MNPLIVFVVVSAVVLIGFCLRSLVCWKSVFQIRRFRHKWRYRGDNAYSCDRCGRPHNKKIRFYMRGRVRAHDDCV